MFYRSGFRRRLVLTAFVLLAACSRSQGPSQPRKFAVLRFENLSGDGSLDWAGRALSELLARELGAVSFSAIARAQKPFSPHPSSAPGVSSEQSAARLLGATDLITGYFTPVNGKLAVTAIEEDAATRKTVRTLHATGDVFSVANAVAGHFTTQPRSFLTRNAAALRLYALGLESGPAAAGAYFEQAAAADPSFGDAYLAWARSAADAGNRAGIERALAAGLAHGPSLPPLDRAYLNFESATLREDVSGRIDSLSAIVKLSPGDPGDLKTLADSEVAAHRFAPAIGHYREALALAPDDAELLNLQSYAKLFAGDKNGALDSIHEYQKKKPQDANALDSEGDIYFYFGSFGDAERLYRKAFALNAAFDSGVDAWKAARARLMTGDIPGASELFRNFHDARAKASDPVLPFRDAEWLYLTGHPAQAATDMAAAAQAAQNRELRALCFTQASIWELVAGHRTEAGEHSLAAMQLGVTQSLVNAAMVHFLQQPAASALQWESRASREINGSGAERLRRLATAYALLLSHPSAGAAPAWKAVFESENPNNQAPAFLYARALVEAGRAADAQPFLKTNPIPGPLAASTFECLYFPGLFEWRGDHATFMKLGGIPAPVK